MPELFETEADAVREDRQRARRVRRVINRPGPTNWINLGDRHWLARQRPHGISPPPRAREAAGGLARRLEAGASARTPYITAASALWMRQLRLRLHQSMNHAFAAYRDDELTTVTVIYRGWTFTAETLDGTTAAQIKAQFRQHLIRAGVMRVPGPLFAVLHGEFEPTSGIYVLHYHAVTTVEKAAALMRLPREIRGYEATATGAAPVKRKQVRNRARQFSYLPKSYWPSRPVIMIDGKPKRVRGTRRIPEPWGTQVLLWLDRQRFADLVLMNDVWSRRRGGSAAMKELYLSVIGAR